MIILHNIIGFFHAELFVEGDGIVVCYEVDRNVLFSSRNFMSGLHKPAAYALTLKASVNTEVGNI